MKQELPKATRDLVDQYLGIRVGRWRVACPYFMNKRGRKGLSVVEAGKGLPMEIEIEIEKWYEKYKSVVLDATDAKNLMILVQVGVDCSGFAVNILDSFLQESGKKSLYEVVNWGWGKRVIWGKLRPRMNISSDLLTGKLNSERLDLTDVQPGDLIRRGKSHVMVVEWVEIDKNGRLRLGYIGSSTRPEWGVQRGEIEIGDVKKPLEDQKWSVADDLGIFKTTEGEKGLVRLKLGR